MSRTTTGNSSGVFYRDIISTQSLYINGQSFTEYINNLVLEDQFEQSEITELKLLVQYLNTSGLNTEWIVDNNNKNQDLKSLITALETKLAQIDTTALTESSVLNNDNRNSVLKSRLDTNDGNVTTLTNKTRYVTVNHNSGALENEAYMSIDAIATGNRTLEMRVGSNHEFILQNYPSTPTANYIGLNVLGGKILLDSNITEIDSNVDMGKFDGSRDGREFRIGGSMSKIRIGSVNDPIVGTGIGDPNTNDTTEIHIGKQTVLKNTKTYLNGNIYTNDGRFEDLAVSDVVTWQTAASWASGFVFSVVSFPYWLSWIGLSGLPNFRFSDCVKMANNYLTGGLTKNHSIETSNELAIKKLQVINTDVLSISTGLDILLGRLCFQAFAIHGSHNMTAIRGGISQYVGDGEILLRNDGGIFDFFLKDAGNTNQLKIMNADVELIQCNGTSAVTNKLTLGACCGNIEMITATTGIRSNATKVLEVKGNKQVKIGSNSDAVVDDTYKLLIDAATHTNGIKLIKGTDNTLINPKNISTKTITFQDYPLISSGETLNTLYTTDGGAKLYYGEHLVAPFSALGAQGAGAIFIFRQADNITNNQSIINDMVSAYTSTATRTNTVSNYVVHTPIPMGSYLSPYLDNTINSLLHGNYEANIFGLLNATQHCFLHVELAHIAERADNTVDFIIDKTLTYTTDVFTSSSLFWKSLPVKIPSGRASLVMNQFVMSQVEVTPDFTGTPIQLRMRIRNNLNDVLYTSAIINASGFDTTTADRIFTFSPAVSLVLTTASFIVFEFEVLNTQVPNLLVRQRKARSAQDMVYKLGGSWYVRLYDGVNNKVLLNSGGGGLFGGGTPVSYNIPIPLPAVEPYDISQFGHYSKVQLNVFFTQPSGQQAGNSFSIYTGDSYLSHVQTTINIGGGGTSSSTGASSGANNVQKSVVEDELAPVAGSGNTPPEDRLIASTVIIPRKNLNYLNGWIDIEGIPQSNTHNDAYMSDTGRFILTAMGTSSVASQLNLNRFYASEAPWQLVGLSKNWKSCCGSAIGNRMYAVAAKSNTDATNQLYTSINYGVTWTLLANTPNEFQNNNTIGQIRCDGIGRNVFISSMTTTQIYRSDDFGANWQTITIGTGVGTTPSIAVNSVGQYVFATLTNVGVYRSFDFGLTFQLINNSATAWLNISCSATAQYVVATRSGATYAYSDDYGSTWAFGSDTYVDAAMAHSGNLVVFCNNGNIAYSDNNGYSIRATRNTGRNHQSIVINANGQFGLAPLVSPVTVGGSTFEAMLFREPDDNVKNIAAGTGIVIDNDLNGGYTINASAVGGGSAFTFAGYMNWTDQAVFHTLPVMDWQNYDYEATLHMSELLGDQFVYLYWNGTNSATWEGEFVYMTNVALFAAGADQPVPYMMINRADAVTFLPGTNSRGSSIRDMILTMRFRGISQNRFSVVLVGRPQIFYTTAQNGVSPPTGWGGLQRATYSVSGNNANWAPQTIRIFNPAGNKPVRLTWHRINKISSA